MLRGLLTHPLTRGMDLDDPRTTEYRRRVIADKPMLRTVYESWYRMIVDRLPAVSGPTLELGTGAGFLGEMVPGLVTTDIQCISGISSVCSGMRLPFRESSLRAVVQVNVFHHMTEPECFLDQCRQCLKPGGRIILLEPWLTPASRLVYAHLHHEPCEPRAPGWRLPESGPLSGGNDAQAWIVFHRDRKRFEERHADLVLNDISLVPGLRYVFSGGVSMRSLVPSIFEKPLQVLENALPKRLTAMFAMVTLELCDTDRSR